MASAAAATCEMRAVTVSLVVLRMPRGDPHIPRLLSAAGGRRQVGRHLSHRDFASAEPQTARTVFAPTGTAAAAPTCYGGRRITGSSCYAIREELALGCARRTVDDVQDLPEITREREAILIGGHDIGSAVQHHALIVGGPG